jgi:mycofactocin system transcriptional regulator
VDARTGRPRATSRAALERVGFRLFAERGFAQTTVDDIAAAAGIGRRTFFRYFASKNDLVWGDFSDQLESLRALLDAVPPEVPVLRALREAVVAFNRYEPTDVPWHRQRMRLILTVPALQADATLRYAAWRAIVTGFAARRLGLPEHDPLPRLFGHALLAAAITAYEQWLHEEDQDLSVLLDEAISRLAAGLGRAPAAAP